MMEPFFNVKNFKNPKKVMETFFGIKNFKTMMVSFFSIKNFKSRDALPGFFCRYFGRYLRNIQHK